MRLCSYTLAMLASLAALPFSNAIAIPDDEVAFGNATLTTEPEDFTVEGGPNIAIEDLPAIDVDTGETILPHNGPSQTVPPTGVTGSPDDDEDGPVTTSPIDGAQITTPPEIDTTLNIVKRNSASATWGHDPVTYPGSIWGAIRATSAISAHLPWNTAKGGWSAGAYLRMEIKDPSGGNCASCTTKIPSAPYVNKVDTGAAAIILGPKAIGGKANINQIDPGNTAGYQYYNIQKKLVLGRWVKLQITLKSGNSNSNDYVIATPTVLIATYTATCFPFAQNADWQASWTKCPTARETGGAVLPDTQDFTTIGMGWGQYNNNIPVSAQFVRGITHINGNSVSGKIYYKGYIVGKRGIQFGMTHLDQCYYYKLAKNSQNSADWARSAGCIQFYKTDGTLSGDCQQGQIMPDTGVSSFLPTIGQPYSYPTAGASPTPSRVAQGAKVELCMGRRTFTGGSFFRVSVFAGGPKGVPPISGQFSPLGHINPTVVGLNWASYGSFTNPGRQFYSAVDQCYDPTMGWVGYRMSKSLPWPRD